MRLKELSTHSSRPAVEATVDVVQKQDQPILLEGKLIGFKSANRPESFGDLKLRLSDLGVSNWLENSFSTLSQTTTSYQVFELIFRESLGILDSVELEGNFPIEVEDGCFVLYHDTFDADQILSDLNNNQLFNRPSDPTWAARCFGLGLTCYANSNTKLMEGRKRVKIKVPMEAFAVVEKKSLWNSFLEKIWSEIGRDEEMKDYFLKIMNVVVNDPNETINNFWKRTQAFDYTGYMIDAFCYLNKNFTRLKVRTGVQGHYVLKNGDLAEYFGYRRYTSEAFLDENEMIGALMFVFEEDGADLSNFNEVMLRNLSARVKDAGILDIDAITGWDGTTFDIDSKSFQHYCLSNLVLRPDFREMIKQSDLGEPPEGFWDLLDGYYPIEDISMPDTSLIFGTDLGSNNVVVLRNFDPEKMSFEVLE
jgi:hypothetical protein